MSRYRPAKPRCASAIGAYLLLGQVLIDPEENLLLVEPSLVYDGEPEADCQLPDLDFHILRLPPDMCE